MSRTLILDAPYTLLSAQRHALRQGVAVAVQDDVIVAVAEASQLQQRWPDAEVIRLDHCLLMPGLVNAHQHGRGLSMVQLGYADTFLEPWMAARRGRAAIDCHAVTQLAAARMIANGVTTTVHANYTYGTGHYEQELLDQLRAYDSMGIRATVCVGAMDQGSVVYPPQEACFMAGLPADLHQWLSRANKTPYAGDAAATVALMQRLRNRYADHPTIRLCYGPAGPQWVSDDLWKAIARDAREHDLGIHFHALESPAQKAAVSALFPDGVFSHLERLGAMTPRTVLAHGVWVADGDMDILARSGVTVVGNPGCNLRMRNGIAPFARYLAHGVRVAVGTDNCTVDDDEDLISELRLLGILGREADWNGPPPPTSEQLLAMATTHGAIAAQFGGDVGTLDIGMKADIVAFSLERTRQPYLDARMPLLDAFLARAHGADNRLTMVNGKVLYQDGQFTNAAINELESHAREAAETSRRLDDPNDATFAKTFLHHLCHHYQDAADRPSG